MPRPQFEKFERWAPDQGIFGTQQSEDVVNVIKTQTGFRPFPGIVDNGFDALPGGDDSFPTGFFFGKTVAGNAQQFVAMYDQGNDTDSKIYRLETPGRWIVASTWIVGSEIRFRTAQWDDVLYICNQTNGLRSAPITGAVTDFPEVNYVITTTVWSATVSYPIGTLVDHLGIEYIATAQTTIGNDPLANTPDEWSATTAVQVKPRFMATIRDFLVVANLNDDDAAEQPNRVRWSGINQPSVFHQGGDPVTLSDFRDLPDAGAITGILGGEYGTVLCENGLFRMDFVGPPNVFSFNRIERARGCLEPNSVVIAENVAYYFSDDGWKSFDGQQVASFGAERFDRFFRATAIQSELIRMAAVVNPNQKTIIWGHNAGKKIVDRNDRLLIYNYDLQEATYGHLDHSLFGTFITPSVNIDTNNTRLVRELQDTDTFTGKWTSTAAYTSAANDVVTYHPTPPATHVWQGKWLDATAYALDDIVYLEPPAPVDNNEDDAFICTSAHTSEVNFTPRSTFRPVTPGDPDWRDFWDQLGGTSTAWRCTTDTTGDNPPPYNLADWEEAKGTPVEVLITGSIGAAIVEWTVDQTLALNSPIHFTTTGALPSPLVVDQTYYVVSPSHHHIFNIADHPDGDQILITDAGSGTHTAEALVVCPIDQMGRVPWDSTVFKPDAQLFGALSRATDTKTKLHVFSGFPDECTIATAEFRPAQGRSRLQKLQVAIEGDNTQIEAQLESRNQLGQLPTITPYKVIGPDQSFRFNADARYHRIRVRMTGAWRDGTGIFHESTPTTDR